MTGVNVFRQQSTFMKACGQTSGELNIGQYNLYLKLIHEEYGELIQACNVSCMEEEVDALIDLMVVTIGALHSLGVPVESSWLEVMLSNLNKLDSDGNVQRRSDGKILKPLGWVPPDINGVLDEEVQYDLRILDTALDADTTGSAANLRTALILNRYTKEK